jgi:hypothetical protein
VGDRLRSAVSIALADGAVPLGDEFPLSGCTMGAELCGNCFR